MRMTQELSWLRFNRRVLDQTRRPDFPVLERIRFLGIWASNLDEFYAARIGRPFLQERGAETYRAFLAEEVAPRVDVVPGTSVRDVRSQALYLASGRGVLEHLLRLPEAVARLLEIPGRDGTYVRLGELVRSRSDLFLPAGSEDLYEFRVVRLAALEERTVDWADLPAALESR